MEYCGNSILAFGTHFEPERVYVCLSCGRRSLDRQGNFELTFGWDENCAKAAIRLPSSALKLDERGLVVAIKREAIIQVQRNAARLRN